MVSESGKYHVKLQFLDRFYKVEVDDCFPIALLGSRWLFPWTPEATHIWPMLLMKALLKFFHKMDTCKVRPSQEESASYQLMPNGKAFYALTGFLAVEKRLNDRAFLIHDLNPLLKVSLNDQNFSGNLVKVIGVRDPNISRLPRMSTQVTYTKERSSKHITESRLSAIGEAKIRPSAASNQLGANNGTLGNIAPPLAHYKPGLFQLDPPSATNPPPAFVSYSLEEFFENGEFNLAFARDFTEEELIIHRKYEQSLSVKTHFMNKEDIIKLKKQRRDLRLKLKEIEKRKQEFVAKLNKALNLVSIRAGPGVEEMTAYGTTFSSKEIKIAKTCIKLGIPRPPNYIDLNELKWEEGSMVSGTKTNIKESDAYVPNFNKSLGDFSGMENAELVENRVEAEWIETKMLPDLFTKLILLYNPASFACKETLVIPVDAGKTGEEKEVLIVKANPDLLPGQFLELLVNVQFADPDIATNSFQLHVYDFESFKSVQELINMKGLNSTMQIRLPNEDHTFRLKATSKARVHVTIFSQTQVLFSSVSSYLREVEEWREAKIKVSSGALSAGFFYVLQKTLIESDESQHLIFNFPLHKMSPFRHALNFDMLFLDHPGHSEDLPLDDRIRQNTDRLSLKALSYENIKVKAGRFMLLAHCTPSHTVAEQSFEISVFSKKEIKAVPVLTWESGEVVDVYSPNKYGQIFKEDVFFKQETLHFSMSLEVKVKERLGAGEPLMTPVAPERKGGAGGKGEKLELDLSELKPPAEPLQVYLEMNVGGKLHNVFYGLNSVKTLNVCVTKDQLEGLVKDGEAPVSFTARFVAKNNPQVLTPDPNGTGLVWVVKLWANGLMCVVKNIKKEETEGNVIRSWESKDPGRADRAAKARLRNLAMIKQANGEQLSEKETALLADDPFKAGTGKLGTTSNKPAPPKDKRDPKSNPGDQKSDPLENPSTIKPFE